MVLRQQTAALSERCQPRRELPVACLCSLEVFLFKSGELKNPPSVHLGKDKGFSGKHLETLFPFKVKLHLGSPTDRGDLVVLYLKRILPLACGHDVCA